MSASFWNGLLREHADAQSRVSKAVTPTEYRGWSITWDYGYFTATGPNYDASWEGEEDGWVDNGETVSARTLSDLYAEVDEFLATKTQKVASGPDEELADDLRYIAAHTPDPRHAERICEAADRLDALTAALRKANPSTPTGES